MIVLDIYLLGLICLLSLLDTFTTSLLLLVRIQSSVSSTSSTRFNSELTVLFPDVCLNSFVAQIRENLALCSEKVQISSPQGSYIVKKFIYRSTFKLKSGSIIGQAGGTGGFGPGGIEVAHEDWTGLVVLETEGSTEHATSLMASCTSTQSTPWRFIREKSRPGSLLLR